MLISSRNISLIPHPKIMHYQPSEYTLAQSSQHIESNHYTSTTSTSVPSLTPGFSDCSCPPEAQLAVLLDHHHHIQTLVLSTAPERLREFMLFEHGCRCIGKGAFPITLAIVILIVNSYWVPSGCNGLHTLHLAFHNNPEGRVLSIFYIWGHWILKPMLSPLPHNERCWTLSEKERGWGWPATE